MSKMLINGAEDNSRKAINRRVWRDFMDCYTQHGSDVLLARYHAGESLSDIASERSIRDKSVVAEFFTARYGDGWQREEDKPKRASVAVSEIIDRIKAGATVVALAMELNTNPKALRQRIRSAGFSIREAMQ